MDKRGYSLLLTLSAIAGTSAQVVNALQTVSVFATCGVPTTTVFPQGFSGTVLPSFTFAPSSTASSSCSLTTATALPAPASTPAGDSNFPICSNTTALDACTSVQGQTCQDENGVAYTFSCASDVSCGTVLPDNTALTKRSFVFTFAECLDSCDGQAGCVAATFDPTNSIPGGGSECRLFSAVVQTVRVTIPLQLAIRWFAALGGPIPFPRQSSSLVASSTVASSGVSSAVPSNSVASSRVPSSGASQSISLSSPSSSASNAASLSVVSNSAAASASASTIVASQSASGTVVSGTASASLGMLKRHGHGHKHGM